MPVLLAAAPVAPMLRARGGPFPVAGVAYRPHRPGVTAEEAARR